MQQATVNLFADMGAQPYTLISGLTAATASTDTTAPTSTITSPSRRRDHRRRQPRSPSAAPRPTRRRRGRRRRGLHRRRHHLAPGHRDDQLDLQLGRRTATRVRPSSPGRSTTAATSRRRPRASPVNVGCPCSIWGTEATPGASDSGDATPVEVGVKFTLGRRRLRHRHPVLQGAGQHRHPHREPVDRVRDEAGIGHVHRRDRRPAGSPSPSRARCRSTRTRRTWPPTSPRSGTPPRTRRTCTRTPHRVRTCTAASTVLRCTRCATRTAR